MTPYFITGVARTRTAWLANFLTWGTSFCHHELMTQCRGVADLSSALRDNVVGAEFVGDSDPSLGLFAEDVIRLFPDSRFVFVERPLPDAALSMAKSMKDDHRARFPETDYEKAMTIMKLAKRGLNFMWSSLPDSRKMRVSYQDLDNESAARSVWDFCIPQIPFPSARFELLEKLRVTQIHYKVLESPDTVIRNLVHETVLENKPAFG